MVRVKLYYRSWFTPVVAAAVADLAESDLGFKSGFSVPALASSSIFGFDCAGSGFASALDASACCGLLSD
jgi:hypothetical protein